MPPAVGLSHDIRPLHATHATQGATQPSGGLFSGRPRRWAMLYARPRLFPPRSVCPRDAIALVHGRPTDAIANPSSGRYAPEHMFLERACYISYWTLSYHPLSQPMPFVAICAERRNELNLRLRHAFSRPSVELRILPSGPRPVSRPPTTSEVGEVQLPMGPGLRSVVYNLLSSTLVRTLSTFSATT